MTEVQRTPQQIVSRDVPAEIESYKAQLKAYTKESDTPATD